MSFDPRKFAIDEHKRWIGYLQPDGVVVSPVALVDFGVQLDASLFTPIQEKLLEAIGHNDDGSPIVENFAQFAQRFLGWRPDLLAVYSTSDEVPEELNISTGEYGETLRPDAAYKYAHPADPARPWMLLVRQLPLGTKFDTIPDEDRNGGWVASPTQKFERLLRATDIPIGILANGREIRLLYAPRGENSGSLTFPVRFMTELAGRAVATAFDMLLSHRRLVGVTEAQRLPALLKKSREYQGAVSTALADQVLEALYELVRGFQAADARTRGKLLRDVLSRDPDEIYHALLTVLLRLVFLLFAEDRGLMPGSTLFQRNYAIHGLFEKLRVAQERYPDTMDGRFGAWAQLLTVCRLVFEGCGHPELKMPARLGHLFDPHRFPFLEGRSDERSDVRDPLNELPLVSDGTLYRVLEKLLILDGERLSYRALDVEQIGSVYQTMIGFILETATGTSIALKPAKSKGAPAFLNLDELLACAAGKRAEYLQKATDHKLTGKAASALREAATHDDLLAALDRKIARAASPDKVPPGSLILQPTDERRRSGSHYTPRALTAPIVRKTLEPILARLGEKPTPQQILDLKICDPAVGSGAFLVEGCRHLGDALATAWQHHGGKPVIPPDEDELLHARRLVAQRCLYGVDRNPMATDLAKLSLWLATLAKDHPFTFLDHSLRTGDALVGLSKKQIVAFHWDLTAPEARQRQFGQQRVEKAIELATSFRREILEGGDFLMPEVKAERLKRADSALDEARRAGDLCIAAFFGGDKPKPRAALRERYLDTLIAIISANPLPFEKIKEVEAIIAQLRKGAPHPVLPFHWEIEFPEVFARENGGFDAFIGNPPYGGKNTIADGNREGYIDWLKTVHEESHGSADLVAHFFRRAFHLLRRDGTFGLIATNTIRQGDTRHTGLRWICVNGGTIYAARRRYKWVGAAAVTVSVVWVVKGTLPAPFDLDGQSARIITAYLFHDGGHESPAVLAANSGKSFQGPIVLGMGFTFDDTDKKGVANPLAEMKRLIAKDPSNAERIFPYLGGDEVNESPTHSHHRYVINFADFPLRRAPLDGKKWLTADDKQREVWLRAGIVPEDYPEPVAADWPDLLEIVEQKVKPERAKLGDNADAKRRREQWWKWGRYTPALFSELLKLSQVLVLCQTSKHLGVGFSPATVVFSHKTVVFTTDRIALFGLLQNTLHLEWMLFFGSSLEDRPVYTPTDCFETFPFPDRWEADAALEAVGREYYEARATLMVANNEGLTKTYNHFHDEGFKDDPCIKRLHELHAKMDHAVLAAYGWSDLVETGRCTCEFLPDYYDEPEQEGGDPIPKSIRYRWPDATRDEVLARLLKLNAERAAEERKQSKAEAARETVKRKKPKAKANLPLKLFPAREEITAIDAAQPWKERVIAFTLALPSGTPRRPSIPLLYYRLALPALVQVAGGRVPWELFHSAALLLADLALLKEHLPPSVEEKTRRWFNTFTAPISPDAFGSALDDAIQVAKTLRIVGESPNFELRLAKDISDISPWIKADVQIALTAALRLSAEKAPSIAADLRSKIIQFATAA